MFEIIDGRCYHDPYLKPEIRLSDDLETIEISVPRMVFFEALGFLNTNQY